MCGIHQTTADSAELNRVDFEDKREHRASQHKYTHCLRPARAFFVSNISPPWAPVLVAFGRGSSTCYTFSRTIAPTCIPFREYSLHYSAGTAGTRKSRATSRARVTPAIPAAIDAFQTHTSSLIFHHGGAAHLAVLHVALLQLKSRRQGTRCLRTNSESVSTDNHLPSDRGVTL